jgi:aspartate kinase
LGLRILDFKPNSLRTNAPCLSLPAKSEILNLNLKSAMQVFKFGGASVNSVERVKNVGDILKQYSNEKILVVISAMGKTTNALEKVTDAFYAGKKDEALQLFQQVKQQHLNTAKYLLVANAVACEEPTK